MACHGPRSSAAERGAALLETLIAAAIVITVSSGVGGLLLWSTRALWATGTQGLATVLARQKVEQLLALEWRTDSDGARFSDVSTDVAVDPAAEGGSGLQPTPGGTLTRNVSGYADFVRADGLSHPAGTSPPAGAVFVRRWAIAAHALDPADTVIITVVVLPLAAATQSGGMSAAGVTLQTVRTRTLR
jgi:hypothetical protein